MKTTNRPMIKTLIMKMSNIEKNEFKITLASFCMIFILMAAYFILRPVRDAMASDWSDAEVSTLWNLQFFISIIIVSVYGYATSKLRFKNIVPLVYGAFAASFFAFYLVISAFDDPVLIEKTFYIWVSAFSLLHLSVFWSFMSDTFNKHQSKRLFSIIAAGGSAGAIFGPMITRLFADKLGLETLMMIAALALISVIPLILYIYHLRAKELHKENTHTNINVVSLNKDWMSGFKAIIKNPNLLGIGMFILLYVFIGSFIYFEQKHLLAEYTRAQRVEILSSIDWLINTLTFVLAFFVTGRITHKFGMPTTLAIMPVFLMLGLFILALAPAIVTLLAIQTVRKSGNYAITRPAREMLFTQVSPEERFKAKPVIDMVIYRGGDAISGSIFALLTEGIGFGIAVVALIGSFVAGLWSVLAIKLGIKYESDTLSQNTLNNPKTAESKI